MATLSEYYDAEARECLEQLQRELDRPHPDGVALHRSARALRGSAQMAREERVARAASVLERATRGLSGGWLPWSDDVRRRALESVADLRALVDRSEDDMTLDAMADAVLSRWHDVADRPAQLPAADATTASLSSEFRTFVAREVAAIADALDRGVQQLAGAPMDREPLKMILRRQRVLLGAARLQEIPVVAEILHAVDDLTRVIAKLDVGVKREWLDIFRVAREGLKATLEPLQRDQDPPPSHSLSRLRHMREELLERYGAGEAVSAHDDGFTQATAVQHGEHPTPAEVATGGAPAQQRARPALEEAIPSVELLLEDEAPADEPELLLLEDEASANEPELLLLEDEAPPDEAELLLLDDEAPADEPELLLLEDEALAAETELLLDDEVPGDEPELPLLDAAAPQDEPVLLLDEELLTVDEEILVLDVAAEPYVEGVVLEEVTSEQDAVLVLSEYDVAPTTAQSTAVDAVTMDSLTYDRQAALRRALELRDIVAHAGFDDPAVRAAIDELYDLISIALRA